MAGNEYDALATDLNLASVGMEVAMTQVFRAQGELFAADWRRNAAATSGKHGRHYPYSIESKLAIGRRGVAVATGPNPSKPQGGMSFEYGSKNQPPHLDGLRALPEAQARLIIAANATVRRLLP